MTIEERFERIEHVTAGIAEERRKDRDENKNLWRDTQRQIFDLATGANELRSRIEELGERIDKLATESRAQDKRTGQRIDQLGEHIDQLVSAIGQLITRQ